MDTKIRAEIVYLAQIKSIATDPILQYFNI